MITSPVSNRGKLYFSISFNFFYQILSVSAGQNSINLSLTLRWSQKMRKPEPVLKSNSAPPNLKKKRSHSQTGNFNLEEMLKYLCPLLISKLGDQIWAALFFPPNDRFVDWRIKIFSPTVTSACNDDHIFPGIPAVDLMFKNISRKKWNEKSLKFLIYVLWV